MSSPKRCDRGSSRCSDASHDVTCQDGRGLGRSGQSVGRDASGAVSRLTTGVRVQTHDDSAAPCAGLGSALPRARILDCLVGDGRPYARPVRKRSRTFKLHPALLSRAEDWAVLEGRSVVSVIEQGLAELLHVPLVDVRFPEGSIELCARCRAGVMWQSRCPVCGHHGRAEVPRTHARGTTTL